MPRQALCGALGHSGDLTGRDSPLWEVPVRWVGMGAIQKRGNDHGPLEMGLGSGPAFLLRCIWGL